MGLNLGSVMAGIGFLIFAFLVLNNWQGANALLGTTATGGGAIIKDLQGR